MNDTILAALVGGLLASLPTLIITAANIREDRRRRIVDCAVQCAIAEWKEAKDMAVVMSARGQKVQLAPFSVYYLGSLMLFRAIDGTETDEEMKEKIKKVKSVHAKITEGFKEA